MKVSKVNYEQLFPNPYVQFGNIRFNLEIILEEGDTIADAFTKGHKEANENFNRLFPVQDNNNLEYTPDPVPGTMMVTKKEPPIIDRSIERLEILIDDCKTVNELMAINGKELAKICSTASLEDHYKNKLEELSK